MARPNPVAAARFIRPPSVHSRLAFASSTSLRTLIVSDKRALAVSGVSAT